MSKEDDWLDRETVSDIAEAFASVYERLQDAGASTQHLLQGLALIIATTNRATIQAFIADLARMRLEIEAIHDIEDGEDLQSAPLDLKKARKYTQRFFDTFHALQKDGAPIEDAIRAMAYVAAAMDRKSLKLYLRTLVVAMDELEPMRNTVEQLLQGGKPH